MNLIKFRRECSVLRTVRRCTKSVGDAGAAAAADMKARQSAATEGLTKDWQNVSRSVDETHRRVTELNQRMRENDGQAAALARRQDELAASFFRQIDGVRQLNGETQSLANVQARFRAARAQGNITQQDYLALISRTTARQKNCRSWRKNRPRAHAIPQPAEATGCRAKALRYRAAAHEGGAGWCQRCG
jgi:hypothetical protein